MIDRVAPNVTNPAPGAPETPFEVRIATPAIVRIEVADDDEHLDVDDPVRGSPVMWREPTSSGRFGHLLSWSSNPRGGFGVLAPIVVCGEEVTGWT